MRRFLKALLINGVWFAALFFNLLSAAIATIAVVLTAIITKWINLKL